MPDARKFHGRWAARLGALCLLPLALGLPARGDFTNGGFESGLTGFTRTGDVGTIGTSATFGGPPPTTGPAPSGAFQALLATTSSANDLNNFSGNDAVPATDLESFLGLAAGTLDRLTGGTAVEGSALAQTFTAAAGDVVRFEYNFLTTESGSLSTNDSAIVVLTGPAVLADSNHTVRLGMISLLDLDPIFGAPTYESGYATYSAVLPGAGTYTLALAVVDNRDAFGPSGLLVDNLRLTPAAVPEPAAAWLLLAGAALMAPAWRRKHRATSPGRRRPAGAGWSAGRRG